jgi:nitrogenase-associated protein
MATVVFFEKPGCINNARQKKLLAASGHTVIAKSILTHPWTAESLLPFFSSKPVSDWFNRASPRVKSGEVAPEKVTAIEAVELMLKDPLLIRRPLLEVDGHFDAGFDQDRIAAWIGLSSSLENAEECQRKE